MKFSHAFDTALKEGEYPTPWVESAISYRQLKKCIKDVQKELSGLGLEPETIRRLWKSLSAPDSTSAPLKYIFAGDKAHFKPKLFFTVDGGDKMLLDASLAPETRAFLRDFVLQLGPSDCTGHVRDSEEESSTRSRSGNTASDDCAEELHLPACAVLRDKEARRISTTIEVPLTSDSTFFKLLVLDMSGLDALQSKEVDELNTVIVDLGKGVSHVADPSNQRKKADMYAWREIFRLYTESDIFFSTNEQSQATHNSVVAQAHMQAFLMKLGNLELPKQFKKVDSQPLLNDFIGINMTLLKNLKFQELNMTAMMKILKKFDKRTALGARQTFPNFVAAESTISTTLAKRVCFQISEKLVAVVPQLDDYLCPVCFNVSWKPIRLKCNHVFCVRCMLVMQRANNGHCPLCREDVIMEADSTNIDPALMNLLKRYFPAEVKAKQRENKRNAAIDIYGQDTSGCQIM